MMRRLTLSILILTLAAGSLSALHFAKWSTSMGSFVAELYDQQTPITANNFISLANSGFYNGLIFHRVVSGFVIQDGCPYGTGYGGPGYTIPDEFYPGFHHDQPGILAMARTSAPNSAGSQYYITLAPAPHLDGNYAIFGKVVQGLNVVMDIGNVPVDANDRPLTPVDIDTLRILDLAIGNVTPPDSTVYTCFAGESQMFIVEAFSNILTVGYRWFVDGTEQQGSSDFLFETVFAAPGTHSVVCRVSNSDWSHDVVWEVLAEGSAAQDGVHPVLRPGLTIYPHPLRTGSSIILQTGKGGLGTISVYDLKGRKVRGGLPASEAGGWYWDGNDESGRKVSPGVYLIKASRGGISALRRCLVL